MFIGAEVCLSPGVKALLLDLLELREEPVELHGKLAVEALQLGLEDELIHFRHPLEFDLTAENMGDEVLVQGECRLPVDCECARCLKPFAYTVELPEWSLLLPLVGPDKVVLKGDRVDLTPYLREDIVLALPRHPVCGSGCGGLKTAASGKENKRGASASDGSSGPWSELDKLKL